MKFFIKLLSSFILILSLSEILLRGKEYFEDPVEKAREKILGKYWHKVLEETYNPQRVRFFHAPFMTYENVDFKNPDRLKEIFQNTLGPVGQSVVTHNNLTFSPDTHTYSLNKNGFRGPDRPLEKRKGTHRILALGTYQTWGLGVNDDETVSHLLEKEFSEKSPDLKVEVWNAGRLSSKAITGLAHLIHNGLRLKPDLVILDYGFADALKINLDPRFTPTRWEIRLKNLARYSYLIRGITAKLYPNPEFQDPLPEFRSVMAELITVLKKNKTNVLLLEQETFFTEKSNIRTWFREAESEGLPLLRVSDVFQATPPTNEDQENTRWAESVPLPLRKSVHHTQYAPYKVNPFHLNKKGNTLVAGALRKKILEANLLKNAIK